MNLYKGLQKTAIVLAAILSTSTAVLAAYYSDVPSNHWAYSSISSLSDRGIMVGDSSGRFNPNQAVDKFYTMKVLAKAAGFKYMNLSAEEELYINRAYEANKDILNQYSKAFEKWDSTADKELAYLLEKGILFVTDLNQFVVRMSDNSEKLRALNREEYCIFLVRLMGKSNEAVGGNYSNKFADDSAITQTGKPYVYYLKQMNIISGDSEGSFNPKGAVTKATMAVMTDKAVTAIESNKLTTPPPVTEIPSEGTVPNINGGSSNVTNISGVTGILFKVYPSLNAVQVSASNGTVTTYKLTATASIYIDGYLRTINDLKEGMVISGIVNNGELAELRSQTVSTGTTTDTNTNQQLTKIEGTVKEIGDEGAVKTITIAIPTINGKGIVSYTEKSYSIAGNCTVKRNSVVTTISDVHTGEVIYAEVSGNNIHSISLEQKEVVLKDAKLKAKRYDAAANKIVLSIEDNKGKVTDFIVGKDSYLYRDGIGKCKWSSLRIGDKIEMTADYGEIVELNAVGQVTTETGWLSEIMISGDVSSIKVRDSESDSSEYKIYTVANTDINLYELTLDSKIRIKLDSEEVESISVLKEASSKSTSKTGFVYRAKSGYLYIVDDINNEDYEKIYIDDDTKVINAVSGKSVKVSYLEEKMEVYITIRSEEGRKYAKTITIIDYND